jgi:hypothetical protein
LYTHDIANDSENSIDQINKLKIRDLNESRNKSDLESNLTESIDNTHYTSLANTLTNNVKQRGKASSSSSVTSSDEIVSSSATSSNFRAKDFNKSIEIDNEISKLRVEAAANASRLSLSKASAEIVIERKSSLLGYNNNSTHDLENIMPSKFNKKIQDLENYSTIIENAASKMDECVKSMTEVYQSYDENRYYIESPVNDEMMSYSNGNSIHTPSNDDNEKSLYDLDVNSEEKNIKDVKAHVEINCETLTSFDEKLKLDLRQEIKLV